MEKKMNSGNTAEKKKIIWGSIAGIIVIAVAIFAYIHYGRTTSVSLNLPFSVSSVFIDNSQKDIAADATSASYRVSPGSHVVVVNREGFWPWGTQIEATNKTITLSPFMLPKEMDLVPLPATSTDFARVWSMFASTSLSLQSVRQLTSQDGSVTLNISGSRIVAKQNGSSTPSWCVGDPCQSELSVFNGQETGPIKAVEFFDNRNDVLEIAYSTKVFLLEIGRAGVQNYQPVYEGTNPIFIKKDASSLYIKDGNSIWSVVLSGCDPSSADCPIAAKVTPVSATTAE